MLRATIRTHGGEAGQPRRLAHALPQKDEGAGGSRCRTLDCRRSRECPCLRAHGENLTAGSRRITRMSSGRFRSAAR
jgi:hypothetical protein